MDYQSLNLKTVVELRSLAKEMGVRIPAGGRPSQPGARGKAGRRGR